MDPTPRRWLVAAIVIAGLALIPLGMRFGNLWYLGRIGMYSGEWIEVEAAPADGFHAPYLAYVPDGLEPPLRLWLRPNNSGPHGDPEEARVEARKLLATSRWQAEALDLIVVVPAFDRPVAHSLVYTHALDRDTVVEPPPLGRPDQQLLAMANDLTERLDRPTCRAVFIDGFSASGMFANRFTLIHPERVAAAAIGAPGGWPMVPASSHDGTDLPYPAGTADFSELFGRDRPVDAWRSTPMLLYLGDADDNDSVPYSDSYEEAVAQIVIDHFGETPVERWPVAEALFSGMDATFYLDEGVGHATPRASVDRVHAFFAEHDDRTGCAP